MAARPAKPSQRKPTRGRPPLDSSARKRILDATADVFLENGYQRASTSEIARRARTSKQTLYNLFPSKAELFVAVISDHTEHLFVRRMEYLESTDRPQQALAEMGAMTLRLFTNPRFIALFRILVAEADNFPDLARLLWRTCMLRGNRLLAEYLRSRRIGGPRYHVAASQYISFILGDFVINSMLNPDLKLSERTLCARVRNAVRDFLLLHPVRRGKPA